MRAIQVTSRVGKLRLLDFLHLVQEAHRSNRVLTRFSVECRKSRTDLRALEIGPGFNRKHSMRDQSTWEKNVNSCKLQCRERVRETCQRKPPRRRTRHLPDKTNTTCPGESLGTSQLRLDSPCEATADTAHESSATHNGYVHVRRVTSVLGTCHYT